MLPKILTKFEETSSDKFDDIDYQICPNLSNSWLTVGQQFDRAPYNHNARIPHLQPRWFLGCGPVQERELIQKDEQLAEVTKEAAQAAETNKQLEVQVSGSGCQQRFSSLMSLATSTLLFPLV